VASGKTQSLIPFSTAAYKKYTTTKKSDEDGESDGAQQITFSAAAILATIYTLSF